MPGLKRGFSIFTLFLAAILGALALFHAYQRQGYTDFLVYYQASERLQNADWLQLYNTAEGVGLFRYSPLTLPLFWPWAWLEFKVAKTLFVLVQILFYILGFSFLSKAVLEWRVDLNATRRKFILAICFLFVARGIYDSLQIVQVSGLMFFGLALAFWAWLKPETNALSIKAISSGLFIPISLKLGFGILFLPLLRRGPFYFSRIVFWFVRLSIGSLLLSMVLSLATKHELSATWELLKNWAETLKTVVQTSSEQYTFYAHQGSQAIHSVLLRAWKTGFLSLENARRFWLVLGSLSVLVWALSFLRLSCLDSNEKRARHFVIGVMFFLVWMPFTFKYSLPFLVFAVLLRLLRKQAVFFKDPVLWVYALFLALPGRDLIGARLYDWIHDTSLPAYALAFGFIAELKELGWSFKKS